MSLLSHQETCRFFGYRPPLYFWFLISGLWCDILQLFLDYLISIIYVFEFEKVTVCWTVSYILSIAVRHTSHKYLVFGEYEGTYFDSLLRTYCAYSTSIFLSMLTNSLLVNFLNCPHLVAWFLTMIWTGVYNYCVLKSVWRSNSSIAPSLASSSGGGITEIEDTKPLIV
jgi:putative flippase GtrA